MLIILVLGVLILAANLFWQDTLGSVHPILWLAEVLGLFAAYHLVLRLIDRIRIR